MFLEGGRGEGGEGERGGGGGSRKGDPLAIVSRYFLVCTALTAVSNRSPMSSLAVHSTNHTTDITDIRMYLSIHPACYRMRLPLACYRMRLPPQHAIE